MKYRKFIFEGYEFDPKSHRLELNYSLDHELGFKESYFFDFDFVNYDPKALDRALRTLFLMAGVSYYKTFMPEEIELSNILLDKADASFFAKTYSKGLGEFYYVNKLNPSINILAHPHSCPALFYFSYTF